MKGIARMVLVLAVVCTVAALALAKVYDMTKEPIAEALRQEKLAAIRAVLPEYDNEPDVDAKTLGETIYYLGKKKGETVGVAFEVSTTQGYSGLISAMVGVKPSGEVTGVRILLHAETPGLGAKIADEDFLAQYRGKALAGDGEAPAGEGVVPAPKWGVKKDGGVFDQITGATISPRALSGAIKNGLEKYAEEKMNIIMEGGEK